MSLERALDVVVVGGGIAGLTVAHRLAKQNSDRLRVRVLERSTRWGGLIQSDRQAPWLFEGGPDSMVTAKPAGFELCRELGLEQDVLSPTSAATFSLVHRGVLHPLPEGFRMIAPTRLMPLARSGLLSPLGKLKMALEGFAPNRELAESIDGAGAASDGVVGVDGVDESVESFVVRRFGRETYERLAEPVLGGLFVADASKLSARRTLGPFMALETRFGSVKRGLKATAGARSGPQQKTLGHGMQTMINKLVESVPENWLRSGCAATRIQKAVGGEFWTIETTDGVLETKSVVLALPSPGVEKLLGDSLPEVARALGELDFVSCAVVNLVYQKGDLETLPRDFGFFAPASESLGVLAATYSSLKFEGRAPHDHLVIRCFCGGALDPGVLQRSDEELVAQAHGSLSSLLGITAAPIVSRVFRVEESMPQFGVGHLARVSALERLVDAEPNLHLAGGALGLYGIPDCVSSGEVVAAKLIESQSKSNVYP